MTDRPLPRRSRTVPFDLLPSSWGLAGTTRARAEAEYYYEGEALKIRLADINHAEDEDERARAKLKIALEYERISKEEYERKMAPLTFEGKELELAIIDIDARYGHCTEYEADRRALLLDHPEENDEQKLALLLLDMENHLLSEHDYNKAVANIKEEPWIGVVNQGFEPEQGINGIYFEFDWNEHWITFLHLNGYTGESDADLVDQWFADVCRAQGMTPTIDDGPVPFGAGLKS